MLLTIVLLGALAVTAAAVYAVATAVVPGGVPPPEVVSGEKEHV